MAVNLVLVHDSLEAFRKENLTRPLNDEVAIEPLACEDVGELRRWLSARAGRVDGVLFTNELLLDAACRQGLLGTLPFALVTPSGGDLLHMLTIRSGGVYRGNLSRVLLDIGAGAEVVNEILQTQLRPMILSSQRRLGASEENLAFALMQRYRSAWDGGSFDLIVTNHADLLDRLHDSGINAWCLLPSVETICAAAEHMALSIEAARSRDRRPVAAVLGVRGRQTPIEELFAAAERCNAEEGDPFYVIRHHGVVELIGFGIARAKLVGGQMPARFFSRLQRAIGETVCTGWGVGVDIPHARELAARAYRESLFDPDGGSYVKAQDGELYGPFGLTLPPVLSEENYDYLRAAAKRAGVSSLTMSRLLQAAQRIASDEVTSGELARCLGVTQRSASRLLANLAQHGAAELCEYASDSARGRPAKRYRLLF